MGNTLHSENVCFTMVYYGSSERRCFVVAGTGGRREPRRIGTGGRIGKSGSGSSKRAGIAREILFIHSLSFTFKCFRKQAVKIVFAWKNNSTEEPDSFSIN